MHPLLAMTLGGRSFLFTVVCAATVFGCAQKKPQRAAQSAGPQSTAPATTVAAAPADDSAPDREKRPRFGESVVYVDGRPVGVVRVTELPPGLKPRIVKLAEGYEATHYGFVDYARALGIDAKRIKAMHLYGGSRAVVVDRAELTRIGDGITFTFVQGDRGKPRIHWPPVKLRTNSTIDMLSNVAFYVEKAPPVLKDGQLVMPDGTPVEGKVPYAPEEQGNGTRVYVDGMLVGTVKRKKLTDDLLASSSQAKAGVADSNKGEERFSLLAYAVKLRPEAKQAKAIDLVAGDDVIAHLAPEGAGAVTFNVPARNRGQAVVDLPSEEPTRAASRARISAVQLYVKLAAPSRPVVQVDEAREAAIGTGQGGSGSDEER